MSMKIDINKLKNKKREQIAKELTIKQKPSGFTQTSNVKIIYPFEVINDNVYLPFAYAKKMT